MCKAVLLLTELCLLNEHEPYKREKGVPWAEILLRVKNDRPNSSLNNVAI